MEAKKSILIDTDIGDDVDDAFALAFALQSPELEIKAITTVFKNTSERARLACALLEIYGKVDIPVYEGIGMPIVHSVSAADVPCQSAVVSYNGYKRRNEHAVDVILESVRNDPDLIIVAIGPLTNIAIAVLKAPAVMSRANIMMMGGAFGTTEAEWNVLCDPEAASIIFRSGANIQVFGLDVTAKCALTKDAERLAKKSDGLQPQFLLKLYDAWHKASGYGIMLHDPLVIAAIVQPDLIRFEKRRVEVELRGEITRGSTIVRQSFFETHETPNAEIASDVKTGEFIKLFMKRVFP